MASEIVGVLQRELALPLSIPYCATSLERGPEGSTCNDVLVARIRTQNRRAVASGGAEAIRWRRKGSTERYLGVEVKDALAIVEGIDV